MFSLNKRGLLAGAAALGAAALIAGAPAKAAEPIKVGFSMALTGGLAGAGKSALIAMQIWEKDTNAAGGLLGRQVKLIYYDDQTNPATVPGIYTKLLDIDKVDLVVSGYGTNLIAPAMPIMMQRNLTFIALFGLAVNDKFKYNQLLPDPAGRAGAGDRLVARLLRVGDGAESQAQDDRAGRRRCRVREERGQGRAHPRQELRTQDRL